MIHNHLEAALRNAIRAAFGIDADPALCAAQNETFGDYQANFAMSLGKLLPPEQRKAPRVLAETVIKHLDVSKWCEKVAIAGPGFVNLTLSPKAVAAEAAGIATNGWQPLTPEKRHRVVVDYSSPNIAKEMHVGHLRSTIIGDAMVRLLEFMGHEVIRQNHLGDWGTQFGMLITLILQDKLTPTTIEDLESFYVKAKAKFDSDPEFAAASRQAVVRLQAGTEPEASIWKPMVAISMDHCREVYATLGVRLTDADVRGESFYNSMLAPLVKDLRDRGIAEVSDGAVVVYPTPATGDDAKRPTPLLIEKSGGGYLYGTTDLAAMAYRTQTLKADWIVYTTDARQASRFQLLFAVGKRSGVAEGVRLDHAAFGMMLGEDNRPFRTRDGGTVKLMGLLSEACEAAYTLVTEKNPELPEATRRDVARAVGVGAVKYADLSRDRAKDYVFSLPAMLSMDGNTGPYLQYAHARIRSIFRKAGDWALPPALAIAEPEELRLAKHILRFGTVLEQVSRDLKPHGLCTYLYDLARVFSGFYEACPVLSASEPQRGTRLALCAATASTLSTGLKLLGIECPEQM